LQTENDADVVEPDFRQQSLKSQAPFGGGAAPTLIFVDDFNSRGGPAEIVGAMHERVLAVRGLPMLDYLVRRGLSNVHDRELLQMMGLDFRGAQRRLITPLTHRLDSLDRFNGRAGEKILAHRFPP